MLNFHFTALLNKCTHRLAIFTLRGGPKKLFPLYLGSFLMYFDYWWLNKLAVLPGLHADEAWAGLKAHQFNNSGVDHLYGMNTYTGILQPLMSSYFFKMAGLGVYQLRIGGPAFNLLALMIICATLQLYKKGTIAMFFLLIFSQSALFLTAPRVAWEVNTFTLFFISLLIASVVNILSDVTVFKPCWVALFFIANLLGTYNHVLFSCSSVAALTGIILWSLYNKTLSLQNIVILLTFNLINLAIAFITMKYWLDAFVLKMPYTAILTIVVLLALEIVLLKKISGTSFIPGTFIFSINVNLIYALLIILLTSFIVFHGMALFQVMSNYKLLIHAYSYPFTPLIKLLFLIGGCVICFYLFFYLAEDIKNRAASLFAFFIIAYLGLLSIYTISCSFRYYLSIYAIVSIYLAIKMSKKIKRSIPLILSLVLTFGLTNISLYKIFNNLNRPVRPIDFTIGNNQEETSAHFLPNKPLIDFLRKNEIDNIHYISDQYFLEQPILFYKLAKPWNQSPRNTAIIDYDYSGNKQGYMLYRER